MGVRPEISVVSDSELFEYPIEPYMRLPTHYFTMFQHDRWFASTTHLKASLEVQGAALNLIFLAQKQSPIGTLPDDDQLLAKLLRIELQDWKDLRVREINPLRNWEPCRCGEEVRLYHPVVLEILHEAITKRDLREQANTDKAIYQRLKRLKAALIDLGCDRRVVEDDILIERLDEWMVENVRGQRRAPQYQRALEHAARMGWFNQGGRNPL